MWSQSFACCDHQLVLLHEQLLAAPLLTLIGLWSHREEVQCNFLQNPGTGGSKCSDTGESFFKCRNEEVKIVRERAMHCLG